MKYEKFDVCFGGQEEACLDAPDGHSVARSAKRELLSLFCHLRGRTSDWRYVRISDLSNLGFRVWWHEKAVVGEVVKVRIKGIEDRPAKVRWTSGRWIGCEFVQPLSPYVVDHIAGQARQGASACTTAGACNADI